MQDKNKYTVYTVGHSNHSLNYFMELIKDFSVNCIVDVRSVPASSYNPQFNKESLQLSLKDNDILYMYFGNEFGARHTEFELLNAFGKVDFEKVRNTKKFLSGVERLKSGLDKGYNISLMCSEADPFECHRFSMISYYLARNNFKVMHILKDKTMVTNDELEEKLLVKYRKQLPKSNLFQVISDQEQLNLAYRLHNLEVAFDGLNI